MCSNDSVLPFQHDFGCASYSLDHICKPVHFEATALRCTTCRENIVPVRHDRNRRRLVRPGAQENALRSWPRSGPARSSETQHHLNVVLTGARFLYTIFSDITTVSCHLWRVSKGLRPPVDNDFELHEPGLWCQSVGQSRSRWPVDCQQLCEIRALPSVRSGLVETVVTELKTLEMCQTAAAMRMISSTVEHVVK